MNLEIKTGIIRSIDEMDDGWMDEIDREVIDNREIDIIMHTQSIQNCIHTMLLMRTFILRVIVKLYHCLSQLIFPY